MKSLALRFRANIQLKQIQHIPLWPACIFVNPSSSPGRMTTLRPWWLTRATRQTTFDDSRSKIDVRATPRMHEHEQPQAKTIQRKCMLGKQHDIQHMPLLAPKFAWWTLFPPARQTFLYGTTSPRVRQTLLYDKPSCTTNPPVRQTSCTTNPHTKRHFGSKWTKMMILTPPRRTMLIYFFVF